MEGFVITPWAVFSSHLWRRLAKQPSSVSNDTVPRACRVARVAQREPGGLKSAVSGFHHQTSDGEVAAGLVRPKLPQSPRSDGIVARIEPLGFENSARPVLVLGPDRISRWAGQQDLAQRRYRG